MFVVDFHVLVIFIACNPIENIEKNELLSLLDDKCFSESGGRKRGIRLVKTWD